MADLVRCRSKAQGGFKRSRNTAALTAACWRLVSLDGEIPWGGSLPAAMVPTCLRHPHTHTHPLAHPPPPTHTHQSPPNTHTWVETVATKECCDMR